MSRLDELLQQYMDIKKQEDELATKKESLSTEIRTLLEKEPKMKYEGASNKASLIEKILYKYEDEAAIINYLNCNKLNEIYIVKKIDTSKFNKELKSKGTLYNHLKRYISESKTLALSVSEVK